MENVKLDKFSERLKELRTSLGMTQSKFSQKIGITASALSSYEKNLKKPSLSVAIKIAENFDISLDWLCGLSEDQKFTDYPQIFSVLSKLSKTINTDIRYIVSNPYDNENGDYLLNFRDEVIQRFLQDWSKMLDLFNDGIIDENLYDLWLNDQKEKHNMYILGSDDDTPFFLEND